MNSKDIKTNINNIYIVGMNHGDVSEKVKELFSETEDKNLNATIKLGDTFKSNMVYLLPEEDNPFDSNAVAVYLESQERLGYVCRYHAPIVQKHIKSKGVGCISAHLIDYNKTAKLISCQTEDIEIDEKPSHSEDTDEEWYMNIPVMRRSADELKLDTVRNILYCALQEKHEWNDYLQNHIQTYERLIWLDLSKEASVLNMNIFFLMLNSPIHEVRDASQRIFRYTTDIGGEECCERWNLWLQSMFESKNVKTITKKLNGLGKTLDDIECSLRKLSRDLFSEYTENASDFSKRLYYKNIPNKKYRRILTLLAVRHNYLLQEGIDKPQEENAPSYHEELNNEIENTFRFPSEFTKEQVGKLVNKFYLGQSVNLALIEIVLFDHGQLKKRNNHTSFIRTLITWGLLPNEIDIKKAARCMAAKIKSPFPVNGYMAWDNAFLNDKQMCMNMAKCLPSSMKYIR
ncbi:MAG: hypothetical protein II416_00485 [Prevotella sp.]|nr:hypothetical protein [Prevotella sp.]